MRRPAESLPIRELTPEQQRQAGVMMEILAIEERLQAARARDEPSGGVYPGRPESEALPGEKRALADALADRRELIKDVGRLLELLREAQATAGGADPR